MSTPNENTSANVSRNLWDESGPLHGSFVRAQEAVAEYLAGGLSQADTDDHRDELARIFLGLYGKWQLAEDEQLETQSLAQDNDEYPVGSVPVFERLQDLENEYAGALTREWSITHPDWANDPEMLQSAASTVTVEAVFRAVWFQDRK